MTATASRWKLTAPDELYLHPWEEDVTVYDGATGDTHLVSPIAAAVLQTLQRAPATLSDLVDEVARADEVCPPYELRRHVSLLLDDLRKLGLVELG